MADEPIPEFQRLALRTAAMFGARPALTVVGTGIQIGRDLTRAARTHIEQADKVFFLVADLVASGMLQDLNPTAESLHVLYEEGKPRSTTYDEMVERVLSEVRHGRKVCLVAYGHPGVFATPIHAAIERARREGFAALMLPAVSAIDCLIADLDIDPGSRGLQIFDASDFVRRVHARFDPSTDLVLLQIALVNEASFRYMHNAAGLQLLAERLSKSYGPGHPAVIYQASTHNICAPSIQRVTIGSLAGAEVGLGSTLYIRGTGRKAPIGKRTNGLGARREKARSA